MTSQVQRKLEFQVRKTTRRSIKISVPSDENATQSIKAVIGSPRKRHSDDEENLVPGQNSPSPSKKKKETRRSVRQRAETPIRGSLAEKFKKSLSTQENDENSLASLTPSPSRKKKGFGSKSKTNTLVRSSLIQTFQEEIKSSPVKEIMNIKPLPLSPRKHEDNIQNQIQQRRENTPVKSLQARDKTPVKSLPLKEKTPVKKVLHGENSAVKKPEPDNFVKISPVMKLHRPDSQAYHQAKQMFHTAKPTNLVGREVEMEQIRKFLKDHMTKKTAGSMYISGAPGTGKTAVLTHIIDDMKGIHSCKTVYLNCMTLKDSATVYGKLYTDITGKNAPTAKERLRAVEKCLTTPGPSIVLVLDEIDQLDSKNQEILYTIFEWPALNKSRLILVGIANALDLTDRILPRLQARPNCKPQLLNFAPYSRDQISAILKDRLHKLEHEGLSVMESSAIQFCARKISAVAGDMRKALDVCRRAVELVETDVKSQQVLKSTASDSNSPVKQTPYVPKKIGVLHISNVLSDVYGSGASAQQQETIPLQQKLVVCTLLVMLKQGRMKEVTVGKLHDTYIKVCSKRQISGVDQSEFQGIATLLESRGILGIKKAKEGRMAKVVLKLDERELEHTLQDKVLMSSILQAGLPR